MSHQRRTSAGERKLSSTRLEVKIRNIYSDSLLDRAAAAVGFWPGGPLAFGKENPVPLDEDTGQ